MRDRESKKLDPTEADVCHLQGAVCILERLAVFQSEDYCTETETY
jgi:hypothetical protein